MKTSFRAFISPAALLGLLALQTPVLAQTSAGLDENARLMQEYMVRRAEWLEFRQGTLDKVKDAKTRAEKKQQLNKLADEEKPFLAKMSEAARAYKAAEKAKHDASAASKPRG